MSFTGPNSFRLPGFLGIMMALLLGGCEKAAVNPAPSLTIDLYEVGSTVARGEKIYHGKVIPADLTRVSFRIPGKIAGLSVQSGDEVRAGQAIARIDDSILRQILADTKAQYQLSRRQLKRAEDLYELGSVTPAQRDELQAAFRLAKANLELARARQSYAEVVAPFDGIVAEVAKEMFEAAAPGETVVTLYRNDRTDILVNVPDGLPARMHEATDNAAFNLRARFENDPRSYPVEYLKHSSARNPKTQAFQFWLTLPASQARVAPGTPATITADLGSAGLTMASGLAVPLTALEADTEPDTFRVWRYRDGRVDPVPVTIGGVTAGGALITGGLQAGDLVATTGLGRMRPGQSVSVHATKEP